MSTDSRARPLDHLLLARLIDEFLFEAEQTLAVDTHRSYQGPLSLYLRYLRDALGHEPLLGDFTTHTARAWATRLRQQPKLLHTGRVPGQTPITLESVRTYLRTLRVFANWLARPPQSYCEVSPLQHFKLPRGEEVGKVPLSHETFARLLAAAGQDSVSAARTRALLFILYDCGLRAKEITQLTIGDVSLLDGVLIVRRAKGKKPRVVGSGRQTNLALRRYSVIRDSQPAADTSPTAPFFQTVHGDPVTYFCLRSWLRRLGENAGVPHIHLHLLRHTSAIETLEAGADVRTVQLKLGHANIATTQRYLNLAARDIGERQRAFSPADRLSDRGLDSSARLPRSRGAQRAKRDAGTRLWRRQRPEGES